jgi:hypothetical protein
VDPDVADTGLRTAQGEVAGEVPRLMGVPKVGSVFLPAASTSPDAGLLDVCVFVDQEVSCAFTPMRTVLHLRTMITEPGLDQGTQWGRNGVMFARFR